MPFGDGSFTLAATSPLCGLLQETTGTVLMTLPATPDVGSFTHCPVLRSEGCVDVEPLAKLKAMSEAPRINPMTPRIRPAVALPRPSEGAGGFRLFRA